MTRHCAPHRAPLRPTKRRIARRAILLGCLLLAALVGLADASNIVVNEEVVSFGLLVSKALIASSAVATTTSVSTAKTVTTDTETVVEETSSSSSSTAAAAADDVTTSATTTTEGTTEATATTTTTDTTVSDVAEGGTLDDTTVDDATVDDTSTVESPTSTSSEEGTTVDSSSTGEDNSTTEDSDTSTSVESDMSTVAADGAISTSKPSTVTAVASSSSTADATAIGDLSSTASQGNVESSSTASENTTNEGSDSPNVDEPSSSTAGEIAVASFSSTVASSSADTYASSSSSSTAPTETVLDAAVSSSSSSSTAGAEVARSSSSTGASSSKSDVTASTSSSLSSSALASSSSMGKDDQAQSTSLTLEAASSSSPSSESTPTPNGTTAIGSSSSASSFSSVSPATSSTGGGGDGDDEDEDDSSSSSSTSTTHVSTVPTSASAPACAVSSTGVEQCVDPSREPMNPLSMAYQLKITLSLDITTVQCNDTNKLRLANELAACIDLDTDRITVSNIESGSVIVTFQILPTSDTTATTPTQAAWMLIEAQKDPNSAMYAAGSLISFNTGSIDVLRLGLCQDGTYSSNCHPPPPPEKTKLSPRTTMIIALASSFAAFLIFGAICVLAYTRRRARIAQEDAKGKDLGLDDGGCKILETSTPTGCDDLPQSGPQKPKLKQLQLLAATSMASSTPPMSPKDLDVSSFTSPREIALARRRQPPTSHWTVGPSSAPPSSEEGAAMDLAAAIAQHTQSLFESHRRHAEELIAASSSGMTSGATSPGPGAAYTCAVNQTIRKHTRSGTTDSNDSSNIVSAFVSPIDSAQSTMRAAVIATLPSAVPSAASFPAAHAVGSVRSPVSKLPVGYGRSVMSPMSGGGRASLLSPSKSPSRSNSAGEISHPAAVPTAGSTRVKIVMAAKRRPLGSASAQTHIATVAPDHPSLSSPKQAQHPRVTIHLQKLPTSSPRHAAAASPGPVAGAAAVSAAVCGSTTPAASDARPQCLSPMSNWDGNAVDPCPPVGPQSSAHVRVPSLPLRTAALLQKQQKRSPPGVAAAAVAAVAALNASGSSGRDHVSFSHAPSAARPSCTPLPLATAEQSAVHSEYIVSRSLSPSHSREGSTSAVWMGERFVADADECDELEQRVSMVDSPSPYASLRGARAGHRHANDPPIDQGARRPRRSDSPSGPDSPHLVPRLQLPAGQLALMRAQSQ